MTEQPSGNDTLILTGVFEGYQPGELFDAFVKPEILTQWWPPVADVTPGDGGTYRLSWPGQNWILEGKYTTWDSGKHLAFTWHWNFDPDDNPPLSVDLVFEPHEAGTCLTVTHGPYGTSEADQTARSEHREGWIHFTMRLAGLRAGDLVDSSCEPAKS
jgi:uncharacterized protein YndB with AHSA1/START domain